MGHHSWDLGLPDHSMGSDPILIPAASCIGWELPEECTVLTLPRTLPGMQLEGTVYAGAM